MTEYIQKRMSGNQLEEELFKYIGIYNKIRNTYLIVYSNAFNKQLPGNILLMQTVPKVQKNKIFDLSS